MLLAWVRATCLALPHTTEQIQWGSTLLFKIGGKMYLGCDADGASEGLSIKVSPEEFDELVERPGIIPAPYLARAKWVAVEYEDAMPRAELRQRITRSYELVKAGLTKKVLAELEAKPRPAPKQAPARVRKPAFPGTRPTKS